MEQAMRIIGLHFVLVYFNGQLDMPHKLAGGPFTTMKGFRLHVTSHPPFLAFDAQGVSHHTEMQRTGIDTWRQGFDVDCVFIFIEIDQRIAPSSSAGQKCRTSKRLAPLAILIEDTINLPTQRIQRLPRIPVCHDGTSYGEMLNSRWLGCSDRIRSQTQAIAVPRL